MERGRCRGDVLRGLTRRVWFQSLAAANATRCSLVFNVGRQGLLTLQDNRSGTHPCLKPRDAAQCTGVVYEGDDFVELSTRQQEDVQNQLSRRLVVHPATVCPCSWRRGSTVRSWKRSHGVFAADPRPVELVVYQLRLSPSWRSHAPRHKPTNDHSTSLNLSDHALFRSATMSLCSLALDRPDRQNVVLEVAEVKTMTTVAPTPPYR